MISSIKHRFDQASFKVFVNMESFLLQATSVSETVSDEVEKFVSEMYSDEIDISALEIVLRAILSDTKVSCFKNE